MDQRFFVIKFGPASVELLADGGASRERISPALKRRRFAFYADTVGFL
jgi:hypothetical protein